MEKEDERVTRQTKRRIIKLFKQRVQLRYPLEKSRNFAPKPLKMEPIEEIDFQKF